ncbi:SRPBCC family protein [Streptomyces sp. NPDC004838]
MATTQAVRDGASGLDLLKAELGDYVGAQAGRLAANAGDRLTGMTDRLTDIAEHDGALPRLGLGILRGDSPLTALVGNKVKGLGKGLLGGVKDKVEGLLGGASGRKAGDTKVTGIIETLDIGVPIKVVYNHWTEYERFSGFTKGVRNVTQEDETTSDWKVKVGPSTRGWKATVQEQIPDDCVIWTSEGSKGTTKGCVTFHELTPTLTRVILVVEYYPSGFFEKTGNIWRAQGRRLRLDFKNFQRYVSLTDEEAEGWRGEIRDGEVVRTHEEAMEDEAEDDEDVAADEVSEDEDEEEEAQDEPESADEGS